jgi:hypothetical protein
MYGSGRRSLLARSILRLPNFLDLRDLALIEREGSNPEFRDHLRGSTYASQVQHSEPTIASFEYEIGYRRIALLHDNSEELSVRSRPDADSS